MSEIGPLKHLYYVDYVHGLIADVERLRALLADCDRRLTYAEHESAKTILELRAEIALLRALLQEMLETHGKPRREEWLNEAAFEHAKAVDERARRLLEQTRKG